jgi:hypothetical protein
MGKLKDQLAGIAALVAAIVAIGGGFIKYGEITTKLDALSESTPERLIEIEENSGNIISNQQSIKILEKEIELLKVQIQELKESASNPLSQ